MTFAPITYQARWILPVVGEPVENGAVQIAGGRQLRIWRHAPDNAVDLGNVAIIPGLVNAHTHLEFSNLTRPLQPFLPFTDWIRAVVAYRRSHPDGVASAIRQGLDACLQSGVTLVGEIATTGWKPDDYALGPQAVVFQELLGLDPNRIAELESLAESHLGRWSEFEGRLPPGWSPHAPYSIHPELCRRIIQQAAQRRTIPIAIHVAETAAELQLLKSGDGEFRDLLQQFGVWHEGLFGGRSPRQFLELLAEVDHGLAIHGNYLTEDDLMFLAQNPHVTLVYCPRTHAAFGHPPHPWLRLLNLGGSVALGTDSRASNPDLNFWAELQFLHAQFPDVSALEILYLATQSGARALGRGKAAARWRPANGPTWPSWRSTTRRSRNRIATSLHTGTESSARCWEASGCTAHRVCWSRRINSEDATTNRTEITEDRRV